MLDWIAVGLLLATIWMMTIPWIGLTSGRIYPSENRSILIALLASLLLGSTGLFVAIFEKKRPSGFLYVLSGAVLFVAVQIARMYVDEHNVLRNRYWLDLGPIVAALVGITMFAIGIYRAVITIRPEEKEKISESRQITENRRRKMQLVREKQKQSSLNE